MDKLKTFIDNYGNNRLAVDLKRSRGTVSGWRNGTFYPSRQSALALAALTGGALTLQDILGAPLPAPPLRHPSPPKEQAA